MSIIQFLNWTYVAVIKETGSYGERLTDDFKSKLKNKSSYFVNQLTDLFLNLYDFLSFCLALCIAGEFSVNVKDSNSYARVIRELHEDEKYRYVVGVVVFAQEDSVR